MGNAQFLVSLEIRRKVLVACMSVCRFALTANCEPSKISASGELVRMLTETVAHDW